MSTNTVALLSATGLLGKQLAKTLVSLASAGKIKQVVILHRPTSDLSDIPDSVERRILDIESATPEQVASALEGIDVLISAAAKVPFDAQERFNKSLAAVTTLKAFIPSEFAVNWTAEEAADKLNVVVHSTFALNAQLRSLGVPLAVVHNGLFEPFLFFTPFTGLDAANNTLAFYGDALHRPIPVTSPQYLAHAIGELVSTYPVHELAGKQWTVIEYETTGQQIVDALAAVHGKPPTITSITDADIEAQRALGPAAVIGAAAKVKWGAGVFSKDDQFVPAGVAAGNLEQTVAAAFKA